MINLQPVTDLSVTGCFFNKQILSVHPLLSQFSYPLQYFDGNICNIAYLLIYPVYGIIFLSSNNLTIDSSLLFKKNCATIRKEEHEKMADKKSISRRTANMINTVTNSNIEIDNGKETFNMCEAIEGIRNEGERIGIIKGERQGEIKGARKANIETAKKIIALGKLSFDEIAAIYNLTPEEVRELAREV